MNLSHASDEDLWFELEIRKQFRYYLEQSQSYTGNDNRIKEFIDDLLLKPIVDSLRRKVIDDSIELLR